MHSYRSYHYKVTSKLVYAQLPIVSLQGLPDSTRYAVSINTVSSRAMAQAVSRRPLTVETRVRSRGQSTWDLWWTKWHWDRFSPSTSVFPSQFHSTGAPLLGKTEKSELSLLQGCTISLMAAVWPYHLLRGP
jgi:hypothetical protein